MKIYKGKFIIRYGILIFFILLLLAIFCIADNIKVSQSVSIELAKIDSLTYIGYCNSIHKYYNKSDSVSIDFMDGKCTFKFDTLYSSNLVQLSVSPGKLTIQNQGRIFINKVKLKDLILKWRKND